MTLPMPKKESEQEKTQRAERIAQAIAALELEKSKIETNESVAPVGCYVARYQARGQKYHYWYYQLKAPEPIFPKTNKEKEYSRFQHLGKAGSEAHLEGVRAVVRRNHLDELTRAIESLKESWLDLYSNEEKVGHRVE
jgi:hypothetical protein